jgi:hypothetical protein
MNFYYNSLCGKGSNSKYSAVKVRKRIDRFSTMDGSIQSAVSYLHAVKIYIT